MIKHHGNRYCKLTDVSVSSDQNTSTKATEKISKYKDLEIEITEIRRVKTEIMPVIVGELALISKGMEHNLGKISGAININELQKIILLETYSAHAKKISVHPVKYPSSTSRPRMGPVLTEYKKQFTALALCKIGHFGCLLVEIT